MKIRIVLVCFIMGLMLENTQCRRKNNKHKSRPPSENMRDNKALAKESIMAAAHSSISILKFVLENNEYLSQAAELFKSVEGALRPKSEYEKGDTEAQLKKMSEQLNRMADVLDDIKAEFSQKIDNLSAESEFRAKVIAVFDKIGDINSYYKNYEKYSDTDVEYQTRTYIDFSKTITTASTDGVDHILDKVIEKLLETDTTGKNLLMYLTEKTFAETTMCLRQLSAQQLIDKLYETIIAVELKGLMMIQFANQFLKRIEKTPGKILETQLAKSNMRNRIKKIFDAVTSVGSGASRDLWRCDNTGSLKGDAYAEIGPLFQTYIMHEDSGRPGGYFSCSENCEHYKEVNKPSCDDDFCKSMPKQVVCNGIARDCRYIGEKLDVCLSDEKGIRYSHIKVDDTTLGRNKTCPKGKSKTAEGGYGVSSGPYHCSYCACTCEEPKDTGDINKYIEFFPQIADADKVVTGARIVLKDNVFRLQIQQGSVLPKGKINKTTVGWRPNDDFFFEMNTRNYFRKLDWNTRSICFDDIKLKDGHVITGLTFIPEILKENEKHFCIKLAVQWKAIDFETGKFLSDDKLFNEDPNPKTRSEIVLNKADVPTYYSDHKPDSKANQFMRFQTTNLDKDVGQHVVPYIDLQPVVSKIPAPLSGVSLIHKGKKDGSGGYIALKITNYDLTSLLRMPGKSKLNKTDIGILND